MSRQKTNPAPDRIKVLPLDGWMLMDDEDMMEDTLASYRPLAPRFSRPGIYQVHNEYGVATWFELPDGRAFAYRRADFDYAMEIYDAQQLNPRQVEALGQVIAQRLATGEQRALYQRALEAAQLRQTYRGARRHMLGFMRQERIDRAAAQTPAPAKRRMRP